MPYLDREKLDHLSPKTVLDKDSLLLLASLTRRNSSTPVRELNAGFVHVHRMDGARTSNSILSYVSIAALLNLGRHEGKFEEEGHLGLPNAVLPSLPARSHAMILSS